MYIKTPILIFFATYIAFLSTFSYSDVQVKKESAEEYNKAIELLNKNNFSEADKHFISSIKFDEKNTAAYFSYGLSLYKQKKFENASQQFLKAIEIDPNYKKGYDALADSYEKAGMPDKAMDIYSRAIAKYSSDPSYYNSKARILIDQKKYADAASLMESTIDKFPKNIQIHEFLAVIYEKDGKKDKVLNEYMKILEIEPGNMKALYMTAQTLSQMGKSNDAKIYAEKVLLKDPNHPRANLIIGDYWREHNNFEKALTYYKISAQNQETKKYADFYIDYISKTIKEKEAEQKFLNGSKQK